MRSTSPPKVVHRVLSQSFSCEMFVLKQSFKLSIKLQSVKHSECTREQNMEINTNVPWFSVYQSSGFIRL